MSTRSVFTLAGPRRNQCSHAPSGEPSSGHPNQPWYPNINLPSSVVRSTSKARAAVATVGAGVTAGARAAPVVVHDAAATAAAQRNDKRRTSRFFILVFI